MPAGYLSDPPPLAGRGAGTPQLLSQQVGGRSFHQLLQHILHHAEGPVSTAHVQTLAHGLQSRPDAAVVQLAGAGHRGDGLRLWERVLGLGAHNVHLDHSPSDFSTEFNLIHLKRMTSSGQET